MLQDETPGDVFTATTPGVSIHRFRAATLAFTRVPCFFAAFFLVAVFTGCEVAFFAVPLA